MFAQTPVLTTPTGPFIILSTVESTNNYAMAKLHAGMVEAGSCFMAVEQTSGKGQRGRHWFVKKGENITMSTVFSPLNSFTGTTHSTLSGFPFMLSASMALGCYDFIKALGVADLAIKWPNDIYAGDRKAAGILIENVLKGSSLEWSVVGTGINLNQTGFGDLSGKAISVKMVTGKDYELFAAGRLLHHYLSDRFLWLREKSPEYVMQEYNSRLFGKGREVRLKKGNMVFSTTIQEVSAVGELITRDTMERRFNVGDIEFL